MRKFPTGKQIKAIHTNRGYFVRCNFGEFIQNPEYRDGEGYEECIITHLKNGIYKIKYFDFYTQGYSSGFEHNRANKTIIVYPNDINSIDLNE